MKYFEYININYQIIKIIKENKKVEIIIKGIYSININLQENVNMIMK